MKEFYLSEAHIIRKKDRAQISLEFIKLKEVFEL
jgi:hypothetical protein